MNKPKGIKRTGLKLVILIVVVLLLCGWMVNSLGQPGQVGKEGTITVTQVDARALLQDTQRIIQKADRMTLVWWIPEEFWWVSCAQDPTITEAQAEEIIKVLRPYMLIAVIDGKAGPAGAVTYKTEAELRDRLQIRDGQGVRYLPLSEDKVDAETRNLLSIMKPIFVKMPEPMGQNICLFLFPANNKKGQRLADAKKDGVFSVKLGESEFRWRLPLGSLLEPKVCRKCKEKCSGAWNFCPWCGTKLPDGI